MFTFKKKLSFLLATVFLLSLLLGAFSPLYADSSTLLQERDQARRKAMTVIVSGHDGRGKKAFNQGGLVREGLGEARPQDRRYVLQFTDDCPLTEMQRILDGERFELLGYSEMRMACILTDDPDAFLQRAGDRLKHFEEDIGFHSHRVANDEYFYHQWPLDSLALEAAWDITTGDRGITIAVIDSGVYPYHPDFDPDAFLTGWDYTEGHEGVYRDEYGHGTFVTGIIGARVNNRIGLAGTCWESRIMPLRVSGPEGTSDGYHVAQAILDAADAGVRVINLSLGSPEDAFFVREAIEYALAKGCIVVASAGNEASSQYHYPSSYPGVISVAAVDRKHQHPDFSNHNDQVTFCAPGDRIWSTHFQGDYSHDWGTSFAAPHVAGIAALALSIDPSLTAQEFVDYGKATCLDLGAPGYDPYHGHGLINAAKLLEAILKDKGQHVVRFDADNGQELEALILPKGSLVPKPVNPAKEDCLFGGWFKDPQYTKAWDFAKDKLSSNLTLYAKWDLEPSAARYSYLDSQGILQTTKSQPVTVITSSHKPLVWPRGWYLVRGKVDIMDSVHLTGDVHLILEDGAALTITTDNDLAAGLSVVNGSHLTIYSQSKGDRAGQLTAAGKWFGAGIGSGPDAVGTAVTINGGKIQAQGGWYAAGIGGGAWSESGRITLNGGEIQAYGGVSMQNGAGIGSGYEASDGCIEINGGKIKARGGYSAAGIGGGTLAPAGQIVINGGVIEAEGGDYFSPGIGAGDQGIGGEIIINGGKILAVAATGAAGIGGGLEGAVDTIAINGGEVTASGTEAYGAGIGTGGFSEKATEIYIRGGTVVAQGALAGAGIGGGCEAPGGQIIIEGGRILARSPNAGAGIGGGSLGTTSDIQIKGGEIYAIGCPYSAGIGGGVENDGGRVTISGGMIRSEGMVGIGGGIGSKPYEVVIKPKKNARLMVWDSEFRKDASPKELAYPKSLTYQSESRYFRLNPLPAFSDVKSSNWSSEYIQALFAKGIVSGYGGTAEFRPKASLTREQAAKIVVEAVGLDHQGKTAAFDDVPKSSWSTGYIAALVEKGAVSGYKGTNQYGPQDDILRSHAAKILSLAFELEMGDLKVKLSDLPKDPLLADAIKRLASNGIVKGYGGTDEFRPGNKISREEFTKLVAIAMAVSAVQQAEEDCLYRSYVLAKALIDDLPTGQDLESRSYLQARLEKIKLVDTE